METLADVLSLTKSSAHRIVTELVRLGYVHRLERGLYRLNTRLHGIAAGTSPRSELIETAEPFLLELHAETQESVNLGVLEPEHVKLIRVLDRPSPLRRVVDISIPDPVFSTALGRAISAFMPDAPWDWLIDLGQIKAYTPKNAYEHPLIRAAGGGA